MADTYEFGTILRPATLTTNPDDQRAAATRVVKATCDDWAEILDALGLA